MKRKITTLSLSALLLLGSMTAGAQKKNVLDLRESIQDSEIIYPESFETDTRKMLEGWYMKNYTATDNRYATDADPGATDDVRRARLAALPTVIDLPYNQIVGEYIDRYVKRGRAQVAAILGLSNYYMPIFEQALEEAGLPLELKYLPVVESALDPNAVSRHGATGLWQFMLAPAKGLGLEVSSLVDERRDPYASSRTAARFLKDLYSTYGDWSLAIAAYNCGPGTVNKALRRAGGEPSSHDFWSIYYFLPAETRGYVPMFIAANYVMNYYGEHAISPVLPTRPLVTDTIGVNDRLHFKQISAVLDIPVDELRLLNPQFRADVIPGSAEKPYTLILPSQQVQAFILSEDKIYEYDRDLYARRTTAEPGGMPGEEVSEEPYNPADLVPAGDDEMTAAIASANSSDATVMTAAAPASRAAAVASATPAAASSAAGTRAARVVTHTVAEGETLSAIATRYGTTVESIRKSNSLRRNAVRAGQKLRVETTQAEASAPASRQAAKNTPAETPKQTAAKAQTSKKQTAAQSSKKQAKASSHEVKSGENFTVIAKKYGVTIDELRAANPNVKGDRIRAGDKVNVPAKKSGAAKKNTTAGKKKNSKKKGSKKRR